MIYLLNFNNQVYRINTDKFNKILLLLWLLLLLICVGIFIKTKNNVAMIDNICYHSDNSFSQVDYYINETVIYLDNVTLISNTSTIDEMHNIKRYKESILLSGAIPPLLGIVSYYFYPNDSYCINSLKIYKTISILLICLFALYAAEYIFILVIICMRYVYFTRRDDRYISMDTI